MAEDFRNLLTEVHRTGDEERWFDDIHINDYFILSVQASPFHQCNPQKMLDPKEYKTFEVNLATKPGIISYGRHGVWEELKEKPWAKYFHSDSPFLLEAENVPADTVQQIYEDLLNFKKTES